MIIDFLQNASINACRGLGNVLFNGFDSDISKKDRDQKVGLTFAHFCPLNPWSLEAHEIVDLRTKDPYCDDSPTTVRLKCAALFAGSIFVQPIGLTLNLVNRICKIVTFAHLWHPSKEQYDFKARLAEWGKDLLIVVTTPLILVGMLFSALYGATLSPYDGRKLYASFERFAYSGGYQFFDNGYGSKELHNYLLAPCFQPKPRAHLGGGLIGQRNVW